MAAPPTLRLHHRRNQTLGSIQTSVSTMNLAAGNSQTITVTAFDTQNQVISNPGSPTFNSTSTTIAEVDNSGHVTGWHAGNATVNVSLTLGSVTRTATVAVTVTGLLPTVGNVNTTSGDIFTPNKVVIGQGGQVTWTFGTTIHNVTFQPTAGAPANISDTYSTLGQPDLQLNGQLLLHLHDPRGHEWPGQSFAEQVRS